MRDAIVRVCGPRDDGTGFFVTPNKILTCAHVARCAVGDAVTLFHRGKELRGTVLAQRPLTHDLPKEGISPFPDLCLIAVDEAPNAHVMRLDAEMPQSGTRIETTGFTKTLSKVPAEEPATFTYVGQHTTPGGSLLKLQGGEAVAGMSGGPLVDSARDAVCGVLKTSRQRDTDRGGWGIPISAVLELDSDLIRENHKETDAHLAKQSGLRAASSFLGDYPMRVLEELAVDPSKPEFPLTIHIDDDNAEWSRILSATREHRRIVLTGQAGAGKTALLRNLVRDEALEQVPFLIDLKRWTPRKSSEISKIDFKNNTTAAIDVLFSVAVGDVGAMSLERATESGLALIMVDGLNEVEPKIADRIIDILDHHVRNNQRASALVTDREITPRYESWTASSVNPIDRIVVSRYVDERFESGTYLNLSDDVRALLSVPFFLTLALKGDTPELGTRESALNLFFTEQVNLNHDQLDRVAQCALDVYLSSRSRSFTREEFKKKGTKRDWGLLTKAGVVVSNDGEWRFAHQLYHDYLASVGMLQDNPASWPEDLLDAVTFHTSSIDPLNFAASQVADAEHGDALLRKIEDWSWAVTMRVMGIVEQERDLAISPTLRIALLANLAEKRFDPVVASAEHAETLLAKFRGPHAAAMRTASNVADLVEVVETIHEITIPDWYQSWRTLFTGHSGLPDRTVQALTHADPLYGWTAANVIRRTSLSEKQVQELSTLYLSRLEDQDSRSRSIRWRTIHAMGSANTISVIELLLGAAANDGYPWVKYGAIRSLMEIAARDADMRWIVIDGCRNLLSTFDVRCRMQLLRSANQRGANTGWGEAVTPLLNDVPREDLTEREQANLEQLQSQFIAEHC
ncbi:trypsin-like peptidase domain-containing protein [Gordonia sp. NPDC003585]|uniref:trypsin-like peptidase domain-containing protein n=1 Tax=Gordonia sp. NPDC003585 TaxID=3154275 RepID=UPI0033BA74F3